MLSYRSVHTSEFSDDRVNPSTRAKRATWSMLMGSRFAQVSKSFFYKDSHRVGKRLSLELFQILVIPLIRLPGTGL